MYNNRQTMLINNLQQHRQKYANMAKTGLLFDSYKPRSASKIAQTTAKTQTSSALKCKFGSQKKIRMDPHFTTTRTNSIISKFDVYDKSSLINKNEVRFANTRKDYQQSGPARKPLFFKTQSQNQQRAQTQKQMNKYHKTQQHYHDQITYRNQRAQPMKRNTIQMLAKNNPQNVLSRDNARKAQQQTHTQKANNRISKGDDERAQQIPSAIDDRLKLTTSVATIKSNYKSILVQPEKTKEERQIEEHMMKQLKFHDVFFCRYCFRYVFAIEKNYHFPKCEAKGEVQKLSEYRKYRVGLQKLNLVVQLSQYTKYKASQMKQIYNDIAQKSRIPQYLIPLKGQTYYTLLEVQTAAHTIIRKLILPYLQQEKVKKYLCNNIACDRTNQV